MKPIQEFLSELAALDVKLRMEENRLRCNAPQGVLTSEIRAQLRARKAEIIKFIEDSQLQVIPRSPRSDEPLPLSWAQERLWFLNQLEGASATYNIPGAFRITGNLELNALQQVLSEIVRRHEILRTSFLNVNGEPRQLIKPEVNLNIKVVDLQQLEATARETVLQQQIRQEAITPFDLKIAPLIRCSLLQLDATEYVLLVNMHHIISDGWSVRVLIQEVSSLYQAFVAGKPSPLAELPIQYADFAVWQRQYLSGEVLESKFNFWQQQLDGVPELLQLPTDRPRPPVQTYRGTTQRFTLNTDLSEKLQKLSQKSGTTLFMTLLATFATLLYRYSGQSDIVVGSPIANRNHYEIEPLIGFFVSTLVLRTCFKDNPSFASLLAQVKETTLQAYEHQDVPFGKLFEALRTPRSLSHSPLFQVLFVLQNVPKGQVELPGVTLTPLERVNETAKFDLTLSMSETDQGLLGSWMYNTDLFDSSTIERMAGHFQNLLSAIGSNPQQKVSELPLLSAAERHQILMAWNDTEREYPSEQCIHQLFEEQVKKTPDAVAVVFENQQLTYQQLNHRANQLAHHLQSWGVGPEVLVGICVARSIEMVVGLLGILKAGGAYVPLDPSYPQERLSYMLADSGVEVLLTQSSLLESWSQHQARVVCLDSDWGAIEQHSRENLEVGVSWANLAYVIYTSGSTGQPKGVMIPHQALSRFTQTAVAEYEITASDRILQFASINFDAAVEEIYPCLSTGATLVLRTQEMLADVKTFFLACQDLQLTVLDLPTAYWHQLVADLANTDVALPESLRLVTIGGERVLPEPVRCWQQYLTKSGNSDRLQLINTYGPTETTVCATLYRVPGRICSAVGEIPIGRPFSHLQVYILEPNLQPVPIGVPGELYIGGDGLARGYLNRPELTSDKFIPNPFSDSPSERLYKTGDLARYLPDGNIEFLGRSDYQVKVRGFRIELGEIESVLNTHPQIQQTVVIAREDIPGNKRLVAYVVTSDESLSITQLREFLQQKLPEYMVPSVFVLLETLPLTPNGKVDRKALPAPDGDFARSQEYVAPRNSEEEIIAQIFAEVLGVPNVGIHDNFFELGGHSLLATQLISRLRQSWELEIPLRTLFEFPTVAQLEQTLTQLPTTENSLSLPPIQPRTEGEPLPLSWAQERLWFLNQLEGASATYNMPGAVRITGDLELNVLQQALSEIVRRHEVLRTSFPTVNGTPRQVIEPEVNLNIKVVDLQQIEATERETVLQQQVQQEATTAFDLERAPLIRCSLWQLEAREYVLLLTMHHIVSDGWSMGLFIQELFTLYRAFSAGERSPLAELPIQYADFAVWQRQYLSGEVLETQLNYWQQQLDGAPELIQLPTDRPRPQVQSYRGATQTWTINRDLTEKLQQLSQESGKTLFMTLLAAFATLLYRYSGQSDIVIGSPIAGRNHAEIEPLIGFFVNTLVLRTSFAAHPSFEKLLAQVRETTLKAYDHQDVPFEQVVEALQPQRSLSHSPLFQMMFVLQNAPMGTLELPGVTCTKFERASNTAKFDLTLSMSENNRGLVGSWEYNTDLFDGSTIERMAAHFQNLLSAIVENPQQKVSELPLLSAAERHQLLVEWNNTARAYPQDKCIHQLFEEQVEKNPDAIAVVFENQQLTYQQLNHRANQLAHYLTSLGVRPEVLVGICVERSLDMVVGLLGILKAGGAYLPLDPNYPQERLSYILADSGVEVLLTQQELLSSLPSYPARLVYLDSDWGAIEQHSLENLDAGVFSDNLAYVIYTSGSTGQPKGVLVTHQNLLQSTNARLSYYTEPLTSFLLLSSFAFDSSVAGIFWTLSQGGILVLPQQNFHQDPLYLTKLIAQNKVSHLLSLPSFYHQILLQTEPQILGLRSVIVAGEPCLRELIELHSKRLPDTSLYNEYGPTEATVWSTVYKCQSQEQTAQVPIGRPIANTQTYILDPHLQPVPLSVPGELYIGGDGLARGYLNRPELTSEKFIPNPFSDSPSERLYKTGDLARYLPDGNIEFLGRSDNQVKIRGFRIELGEIEAVLNTHSQIQQAVVIATEELPGNKRLVAYVVTTDESLSTNQLRGFLQQKLPEYMVPSAFLTLETLPLTPNGKVDKKSLPAPDGEIRREHEYVTPRTQSEEIIAQIFAEVLGVKNVGIYDNFFELGGHSLLAVRLMYEIQQKFQANLSLANLFQNPTIEQLANLLRSSVNTKNSTLVPIKISGNQPPLFCIHPVGGHVLCYADLARHLDRDYPVYGLQSLGLDGQEQPLTALEEMASHYIEAIRQIQPQGPYHLIGWSMGGLIAYEMAQQLEAQNKSVAILTLIDSYAPNLSSLPSAIDRAMIVNQLAQDWAGLYGQELDISLETLRKLEPSEQVPHLFEQAQRQAIFPPEIEIEQIQNLWEVFQANLIAIAHYQATAYPRSIILLNASGTPPKVIEEPTHGWRSLVQGEIQTHSLLGNHYTIMKTPQVKCLADRLNRHLKLIQTQQR